MTLLTFRILSERVPGGWLAQCLETGNVATADDEETALEILGEILEDSITRHWPEDLPGLFDPAPFGAWRTWQQTAPEGRTLETRARETAQLWIGRAT